MLEGVGCHVGGGGVQFTCLIGCRLTPLDGYVAAKSSSKVEWTGVLYFCLHAFIQWRHRGAGLKNFIHLRHGSFGSSMQVALIIRAKIKHACSFYLTIRLCCGCVSSFSNRCVWLNSKKIQFYLGSWMLQSVYPDGCIICFMFGHFKQCKFARLQIKLAKVSSKICLIINEPIQDDQSFLTLCQCGEISPDLVTLATIVFSLARAPEVSVFHSWLGGQDLGLFMLIRVLFTSILGIIFNYLNFKKFIDNMFGITDGSTEM